MKSGVVFNPEALKLFAMKKVFDVYSWLQACSSIMFQNLD
jgi:hypothetical protein